MKVLKKISLNFSEFSLDYNELAILSILIKIAFHFLKKMCNSLENFSESLTLNKISLENFQ